MNGDFSARGWKLYSEKAALFLAIYRLIAKGISQTQMSRTNELLSYGFVYLCFGFMLVAAILLIANRTCAAEYLRLHEIFWASQFCSTPGRSRYFQGIRLYKAYGYYGCGRDYLYLYREGRDQRKRHGLRKNHTKLEKFYPFSNLSRYWLFIWQ